MREPRRSSFARTFLVFLALAAARATRTQEPVAASMGGYEDAGTFTLYQNEEPIVTMEFTWASDGTYEGSLDRLDGRPGGGVRAADRARRFRTVEEHRYRSPMVRRLGFARRREVHDRFEQQGAGHGRGRRRSICRLLTCCSRTLSPALMALAVRSLRHGEGRRADPLHGRHPSGVFDTKLVFLGVVEAERGRRNARVPPLLIRIRGRGDPSLGGENGCIVLAEVPAQHVTYVRDG